MGTYLSCGCPRPHFCQVPPQKSPCNNIHEFVLSCSLVSGLFLRLGVTLHTRPFHRHSRIDCRALPAPSPFVILSASPRMGVSTVSLLALLALRGCTCSCSPLLRKGLTGDLPRQAGSHRLCCSEPQDGNSCMGPWRVEMVLAHFCLQVLTLPSQSLPPRHFPGFLGTLASLFPKDPVFSAPAQAVLGFQSLHTP